MGLVVSVGERLTLDEGEVLSGVVSLENDGVVCGDGTIGLDWNRAVTGDAAEMVSCRIREENLPVLDVTASAELSDILAECSDVGGSAYLVICGETSSAMEVSGGKAVGMVPIVESVTDYLITVRAVNSRGTAVSASVTVSVCSGADRYLVVKDLFPLRAYKPTDRLAFRARIVERKDGTAVQRDDVAGIYYSCYHVVKNVDGVGRVGIDGLTDVAVPVSCLSNFVTVNGGWLRDSIGGNFRFDPGVCLGNWLENRGVFDIDFCVVMGNEVRVEFGWSVIVDVVD